MASVVRRKAPSKRVLLLAATRKGAWIFSSDAARRSWRCDGPHFLGQIVHHLVLDPRDGRTLLAATQHGPPRARRCFARSISAAAGRRSTRPPAFPKAAEGQDGARRRPHVLADARPRERAGRLVRGHVARTACSAREDGGDTWQPCPGAQRRPAIPRVDGRAAGRHAGRPEAALDPRRSARRAITCISACPAAACTNRSTAAAAGRR